MKRLLLAAALLSAAARAESAPSDEAKASIMKAVRDGMAAREAMQTAIRKRNAASYDPEIALLHWTAARKAQSEIKASFDLAIRLTQDAYRLKPKVPPEPHAAKPRSADGLWSAGLSAPWSPEYGPPGYREIRDLPAPVDADWLMDRIEFERRGARTGEIISGVIESVRRAVADGTAALVKAVSPGVATSSPGQNPVRDSGGGARSSRPPGGDNPPLERLRGINGGDSW